MQSWKSRFLSQAGKEIMLKSVIQALPVYTMSCFKLPKGLCKDLSRHMAKFWWCGGEREQKLHWIAWNKVTDPKEVGGLGFRDLEIFNDALLCKQLWRLVTKPNLLMSKVLKSKYFPQSDLFTATSKPTDSWLWKSWMEAKYLLQEGSAWKVGRGDRVNIWGDKWLNDPHRKRILSPKPEGCQLRKVKELMNPNGSGWDQNLLSQLFSQEEIRSINETIFSSMGTSDRLVWSASKTGQFSVRDGYKVAKLYKDQSLGGEGTSYRRVEEEKALWDGLWNMNIKKKVQHFLWRACHDKLPVLSNLVKRRVKVDSRCKLCGEGVENVEHVFFHCAEAKATWKLAPVHWDGLDEYTTSFKDWWKKLEGAGTQEVIKDRKELSGYILWQIWKNRNAWHFQSARHSPYEVVQIAWTEWLEYKELHSQQQIPKAHNNTTERKMAWQPPDQGVVKLNVGSICEGQGKGVGLGIVARDSLGDLLQTWAVYLNYTNNPVIAELEAVRVALIVAQQNEWRRVEIQGDIKAIAECLQVRTAPVLKALVIADDIFLLASMFEACCFSYVHKSFNRFCSKLARVAIASRLLQSWKLSIPLWMQVAALEDIRSIDLL